MLRLPCVVCHRMFSVFGACESLSVGTSQRLCSRKWRSVAIGSASNFVCFCYSNLFSFEWYVRSCGSMCNLRTKKTSSTKNSEVNVHSQTFMSSTEDIQIGFYAYRVVSLNALSIHCASFPLYIPLRALKIVIVFIHFSKISCIRKNYVSIQFHLIRITVHSMKMSEKRAICCNPYATRFQAKEI